MTEVLKHVIIGKQVVETLLAEPYFRTILCYKQVIRQTLTDTLIIHFLTDLTRLERAVHNFNFTRIKV